MRIRAWLTAMAIVASATLGGQLPESVDSTLIVNYKRLLPTLATGGQVSPEGVLKLKDLGFRTVVNLRTAQEGAEAEGEAIRATGLRYVWVPVTADTLSVADARAVRAVLDERAAGPVLLHCASANREAAVWVILEVLRGRDITAARTQAAEIGLKPGPMTEALERVLAEIKVGARK